MSLRSLAANTLAPSFEARHEQQLSDLRNVKAHCVLLWVAHRKNMSVLKQLTQIFLARLLKDVITQYVRLQGDKVKCCVEDG